VTSPDQLRYLDQIARTLRCLFPKDDASLITTETLLRLMQLLRNRRSQQFRYSLSTPSSYNPDHLKSTVKSIRRLVTNSYQMHQETFWFNQGNSSRFVGKMFRVLDDFVYMFPEEVSRKLLLNLLKLIRPSWLVCTTFLHEDEKDLALVLSTIKSLDLAQCTASENKEEYVINLSNSSDVSLHWTRQVKYSYLHSIELRESGDNSNLTVLARYSFDTRRGRAGNGFANDFDIPKLKEVIEKLLAEYKLLSSTSDTVEIDLKFLAKYFACLSNLMRPDGPVEHYEKVWKQLEDQNN